MALSPNTITENNPALLDLMTWEKQYQGLRGIIMESLKSLYGFLLMHSLCVQWEVVRTW